METNIIDRIYESLCKLEFSVAEFYNIATRTPLTIGDITALEHFNTKMWGNFIDVSHPINCSPVAQINEDLEHLNAYKKRSDILKDTTHAIHLANTWLNSVKDCELGKKSEVAGRQWLDLLIGGLSDSLDEIRAFKAWLEKKFDMEQKGGSDNE